MFMSRSGQRSQDRPRRVIDARRSLVTPLLGAFGLAAPAAAQGVIGTGSGRDGAVVALVLGLIGMVLGRRALARSSRTG
jgi:hypothetical protein